MSEKNSKRLRKEFMANQPRQQISTQQNKQPVANQPQQMTLQPDRQPAVITQSEFLQGPIPDPETLERYKNADPTFPERIMKMAEAHNTADVKTKYRISFGNLVIPIIGQVFTLALGLGCLLAGIKLANSGYTGAAIASIVGGFAPIIIGAFKNLRYGRR
jgi:uncharacterized membrane protein